MHVVLARDRQRPRADGAEDGGALVVRGRRNAPSGGDLRARTRVSPSATSNVGRKGHYLEGGWDRRLPSLAALAAFSVKLGRGAAGERSASLPAQQRPAPRVRRLSWSESTGDAGDAFPMLLVKGVECAAHRPVLTRFSHAGREGPAHDVHCRRRGEPCDVGVGGVAPAMAQLPWAQARTCTTPGTRSTSWAVGAENRPRRQSPSGVFGRAWAWLNDCSSRREMTYLQLRRDGCSGVVETLSRASSAGAKVRTSIVGRAEAVVARAESTPGPPAPPRRVITPGTSSRDIPAISPEADGASERPERDRRRLMRGSPAA